MNTINKRVALCNQLNMNFEEANELFDNESLESMQMAKVNGGGLGAIWEAIDKIMTAINLISLVASCCVVETLFQKPISATDPTPVATSLSDLIKQLQPMVAEAAKEKTAKINVEVDSVVNNNWYGFKLAIEIGIPTDGK